MKKNKLLSDFYELRVNQLMDKRIWDMPLIEEDASIYHVLNILGAKNHIWVIEKKESKKIVGAITEQDVFSILVPKQFPAYVFGMPAVQSLQYGTAKTAKDVMCHKIIACSPDDKIIDALLKMMRNKIRRLPVVENGISVGEITMNQLIRKYYAATQYYPIVENNRDKKD